MNSDVARWTEEKCLMCFGRDAFSYLKRSYSLILGGLTHPLKAHRRAFVVSERVGACLMAFQAAATRLLSAGAADYASPRNRVCSRRLAPPVRASQGTERERDTWNDIPAVPSMPPARIPPQQQQQQQQRGPRPPPETMGAPGSVGGGGGGGGGGFNYPPPVSGAMGPGAGAVAGGVKLRRAALAVVAAALGAAIYTHSPGTDPIRDFIDDAFGAPALASPLKEKRGPCIIFCV